MVGRVIFCFKDKGPVFETWGDVVRPVALINTSIHDVFSRVIPAIALVMTRFLIDWNLSTDPN